MSTPKRCLQRTRWTKRRLTRMRNMMKYSARNQQNLAVDAMYCLHICPGHLLRPPAQTINPGN